jgi:hypothetical protein
MSTDRSLKVAVIKISDKGVSCTDPAYNNVLYSNNLCSGNDRKKPSLPYGPNGLYHVFGHDEITHRPPYLMSWVKGRSVLDRMDNKYLITEDSFNTIHEILKNKEKYCLPGEWLELVAYKNMDCIKDHFYGKATLLPLIYNKKTNKFYYQSIEGDDKMFRQAAELDDDTKRDPRRFQISFISIDYLFSNEINAILLENCEKPFYMDSWQYE